MWRLTSAAGPALAGRRGAPGARGGGRAPRGGGRGWGGRRWGGGKRQARAGPGKGRGKSRPPAPPDEPCVQGEGAGGKLRQPGGGTSGTRPSDQAAGAQAAAKLSLFSQQERPCPHL